MIVCFLDSSQNRLALLNVGRHRLLGQDLDTSFERGDWMVDELVRREIAFPSA